jgi:hypothetical protein
MFKIDRAHIVVMLLAAACKCRLTSVLVRPATCGSTNNWQYCLARPAYRLLRPGRRFDLDDVGTPVGKLAHTRRARAHPGEVKHGEACKCFRSAGGRAWRNSDDAGRARPSPIQSFLSSARASEVSFQNVPHLARHAPRCL